MSSAANEYSESGDPGSEGATLSTTDNDYASRTGQSQIPVQKDDAPVEDPIDAATADSDAVLRKSFLLLVENVCSFQGRTRRKGCH